MQRSIRIIVIFLACLFLPALIGLVTNLVNALASSEYFVKVMHWENVRGII